MVLTEHLLFVTMNYSIILSSFQDNRYWQGRKKS
jgi:hypothetical protein